MSWNGNVISAPVSISDVKSAIGLGYNSLGELIYEGGDSESINMFAKYKPVVYDPSVSGKIGVLSDTDRAHSYTKTAGGMSYVVKHGIMIPTAADYNSVVENPSTNPGVLKYALWEYDYPTGGQYKPYRLSDFNGDAANAICPINFYCNAKGILPIPTSGDGTIITFVMRVNQAAGNWSSSTCLSFSDLFSSYANYSFTVHMMCKVNNVVYRYTKSGATVYGMMQSGNVGIVNIDTTLLRTIFSGTAAINADTVWTAGMMLTSRSFAGTAADHELGSGTTVQRLEFESGADRRTLTVKRTNWYTSFSSLTIKVVVRPYTQIANQYYVSSIQIEYNWSGSALNGIALEFVYGCYNGNMYSPNQTDGTNLVTDSMSVRGGTYTVSKNSEAVQTPRFVIKSSNPDGSQIAFVNVNLIYDGVPIGASVTITCNTVSSSGTTFTANVRTS